MNIRIVLARVALICLVVSVSVPVTNANAQSEPVSSAKNPENTTETNAEDADNTPPTLDELTALSERTKSLRRLVEILPSVDPNGRSAAASLIPQLISSLNDSLSRIQKAEEQAQEIDDEKQGKAVLQVVKTAREEIAGLLDLLISLNIAGYGVPGSAPLGEGPGAIPNSEENNSSNITTDRSSNKGHGSNQTMSPVADMELQCRAKNTQFKLLNKKNFSICYDLDWRIPRWVAYELKPEQVNGSAKRADAFVYDKDLCQKLSEKEKPSDKECRQLVVFPDDYNKSGYDRGQMAPAAAFKADLASMSETFLMSNMAPQTPAINRIAWRKIEDAVRGLVGEDRKIWVITGSIAVETTTVPLKKIDVNQKPITVPTKFYKAILIQDRDGAPVSAFGFIADNKFGDLPRSIEGFLTTIDNLETLETEFDFFAFLPDELEWKLEAKRPVWPLLF